MNNHNQSQTGIKANGSFIRRKRIDYYYRRTLKRILRHLLKKKIKEKSSAKKICPVQDKSEGREDRQVKLKCRQLPNVVQEIRKALMAQDWNYVASLTMVLCHPGLKYYTTFIYRVCLTLLFSHPKSDLDLLQNLIRITAGYVLEEDVNKFIKILLVLRKTKKSLGRGKHIRKTSDYKVVRDPQFENL